MNQPPPRAAYEYGLNGRYNGFRRNSEHMAPANYKKNMFLTSSIVYVFLSEGSSDCIEWVKDDQANITSSLSKQNIILTVIYSNNDPDNLFSKYNIDYVPAAYVVQGSNSYKVNGKITADNIMSTVNSI